MALGDETILPSPNRARFWAIEHFVMPGHECQDLDLLEYFLIRQACPDRALSSIDIKLFFLSTTREEIAGGSERSAISDLQASTKVDSLEIYLAEKLWDFRKSSKPKILIGRRDRSDDAHINFPTPGMEVHDIGSEWGRSSDIDPDCCDPSKDVPSHSDSDGDGEDQTGGELDGEDDEEEGAGGDDE